MTRYFKQAIRWQATMIPHRLPESTIIRYRDGHFAIREENYISWDDYTGDSLKEILADRAWVETTEKQAFRILDIKPKVKRIKRKPYRYIPYWES